MLREKRRKNEASPSGRQLAKQDASPHTVGLWGSMSGSPHLTFFVKRPVDEYVYHTTFRKIHTELLTVAAAGEQKPWRRDRLALTAHPSVHQKCPLPQNVCACVSVRVKATRL